MNAITPIRRARRKTAVQVGNVVPLRQARETTEEIIADVQGRRDRQESQILSMLEGLVDTLEARHRDRAKDLVPIGVAMTAATLEDFIEIGQRMLGAKGRRA